jgi:hypothetical protein
MRRREFNQYAEVYENIPKPDGHGGYTPEASLIIGVWIFLKTEKGSYSPDNDGRIDPKGKHLVRMRWNPALVLDSKSNFLRINGADYEIVSEIINRSFDNSTIEFYISGLQNNS